MTAVVGAPPKFLCSAACPLAGANLSAPREGCVAYSSLCTALHRHFGFSSFKAGQLEALYLLFMARIRTFAWQLVVARVFVCILHLWPQVRQLWGL